MTDEEMKAIEERVARMPSSVRYGVVSLGDEGDMVTAAKELQRDVPALIAALRECREVLRHVQWEGRRPGLNLDPQVCPACGAEHNSMADALHAPDCALARCLGAKEGR